MTSECWSRLRATKWANDKPPSDWPTGVQAISLEGTFLFEIWPDNRLHLDGQQLEVSRTIRLSFWQAPAATLTASGTFMGRLAALWAAIR